MICASLQGTAIEVKKDYEITIYWRMTADQFLGKKTEASA